MTIELRIGMENDFLVLLSRYCQEGGWVEYVFWEVIEGKREKPFKLLPPLDADEMEVLRRARDEGKFWLFWQDGKWFNTTIEVWRPYAEVNNSRVVFDRLHGGFG